MQGGVPDINGTARSILRDWVSGRIPYYTTAPAAPAASSAASTSAAQSSIANVSSADLDSAVLLTSFAPAFDLAGLFGEADAIAFGDAAASSSLKGVRMEGIEDDGEDANVGWVTGEGDDESDLDDAMDDIEDDGLNVDDLIEDDDTEMDDEDEVAAAMVVPTPAPAPAAPTKGKKRAAPGAANGIVSVAPSSKKSKSVSFANKALGPTGSGTTTPTAATANAKALVADLAEDAIGANKSIKKNAKKDKKKAAKKAAEIKEVEKAYGSDAEMPSKPRGARVVGSGGMEEAYDFAEFFGKKTPKAAEAEEEL